MRRARNSNTYWLQRKKKGPLSSGAKCNPRRKIIFIQECAKLAGKRSA
jgi:hypothetical protein